LIAIQMDSQSGGLSNCTEKRRNGIENCGMFNFFPTKTEQTISFSHTSNPEFVSPCPQKDQPIDKNLAEKQPVHSGTIYNI